MPIGILLGLYICGCARTPGGVGGQKVGVLYIKGTERVFVTLIVNGSS